MVNFTVGELLDYIAEHNIPRDSNIYYEHIHDMYVDGFEFQGQQTTPWTTIKIKGDGYYQAKNHNDNILKGILVLGGKMDPDEVGEYYYSEVYKDKRKMYDLEDESLLDNYIIPIGCFSDEKKNIYIHAHY